MVAPGEVSVTFPDILPDAEAADLTYTTTPLTFPPDWVMATLFPNPLVEFSDTSKPAGAVAVISLVRLLPDMVNCSILGLSDAVPAQALIAPVGVEAVIDGVEFTVMVKVVALPLQGPPITKLPYPDGVIPTGTVAVIVPVDVLISDTLFELNWVTYSVPPSGLIDRPDGVYGAVIVFIVL